MHLSGKPENFDSSKLKSFLTGIFTKGRTRVDTGMLKIENEGKS